MHGYYRELELSYKLNRPKMSTKERKVVEHRSRAGEL